VHAEAQKIGPEMPLPLMKNFNRDTVLSNLWKFSAKRKPKDFLSRLMTVDEVWL
jgi:hypothetical protein